MESKSVLVIDDSKEMLDLQKIILEGDGFDVFTAQSGTAAFEMLNKMQEPNLIILDQQMEDMTGLEFLELLELQSPLLTEKIPVVMLSGVEPPSLGKAVGFIQKFPDIEDFLKQIHRFIECKTH